MPRASTTLRAVNIPPYTLQLTIPPSQRTPSIREMIAGMKNAEKGWFYMKISDYKDEAAARSTAYMAAQALSCKVTTTITADRLYVEVCYAGRTRKPNRTPAPVPVPA